MTPPNQACFESEVALAFGFLVEKHGCTLHVDMSDGAVEFRNNALAVRVVREPGSYTVSVEVHWDDTGEYYLLHEILRALAPDEVITSECSGFDIGKMKRGLAQLGQVCQRYLGGILALDTAILEKISDSAQAERTRYTLSAQYGAIKDQANDAWERKDWTKARDLYEQAKPALSVTEQRRLEFLVQSQYQ